MISETKLDGSFPEAHLYIEGVIVTNMVEVYYYTFKIILMLFY